MKKKGFVKEFREFILRGNVVDMAVGIIIGAAFQGIVKSLVDDIIMPVVTLLTGGINFENWFFSLDGSNYSTLSAAKAAGAATLNYGVFISVIIQFIIMAFAVFIMIKIMNKVADTAKSLSGKDVTEEVVITTKVCDYCRSEISMEAKRCPHCTSELS